MTDRRLTTADVAALLGITPATWRRYVSPRDGKRYAPPPDGMIDGRTPYWCESTIREWRAGRKGTT